MSTPRTALRRPFSLIAKPTGAACNLDCSYCFFLSKELLWDATGQRMSDETLEAWLTNFLDSQPDGDVVVGWQGGEPTMRGLPFFRRAVDLAEQLRRPGQRITHSLQTNGTLLDDEWGRFLAAHRFLVGISIDGPAHLHDHHRTNKAGRGTHAQVVAGLRTLQRHGVEYNVLTTVNSANQDSPLEVYRHLRDELGAQFIQFIPIVERVSPGQEAAAEQGWRTADGYVLYTQDGHGVTNRSVDPAAYGQFLVAVFDEWVARDVGQVFVQDFDVALGAMFGQYSLCVHAPECGNALAMVHDGDVYACDHYVETGHRLGNVASSSFQEMLALPQQLEFGKSKRTSLPRQCIECPVRWACHGGCPKDRFATTSDGEPGLNHLCSGYYEFFTHASAGLREMAALLRQGRPASDVMQITE